MRYAVPAPEIPTVPVADSDARFPVHRIYCVGRNYADHAREMGHDPDREPPFFFQKNPGNVVTDGRFPYPPLSKDVQFEVELVVALGAGGSNLDPAAAGGLIFGYAVGLDMTRRDLQGAAKKLGRPWEVGKAFEASAPIGPVVPASVVGHLASGAIWLDVNGVRRQSGDLGQMIWSIPQQIAILSTLFTLRAGDLVMTGTPAGVGPIAVGDRMRAHVDGLPALEAVVV